MPEIVPTGSTISPTMAMMMSSLGLKAPEPTSPEFLLAKSFEDKMKTANTKKRVKVIKKVKALSPEDKYVKYILTGDFK